jgi:hypothetical protein
MGVVTTFKLTVYGKCDRAVEETENAMTISNF